MITITFIRHGESEDNGRPIWSGWKDAPLSSLGKRQAQALADSLATTQFTHIYTSDLLRARDTALAVYCHHPEPKPPFIISPLLREQNFGVAEGNIWISDVAEGETREALHKEGIYPVPLGRHGKFDCGESLDDLAQRAQRAVQECVFPHLQEPDEEKHIAIASHGLCISEMMSALLRLDPAADTSKSYRGLLNTAWMRVRISVPNCRDAPPDPTIGPPLKVEVTHFNHAEHLASLPSEIAESEDSEARAFFAGGGQAPSSTGKAKTDTNELPN